MGIFKKFTNKVRGIFSRKPAAPKVRPRKTYEIPGNLGIAARNLTPGKQDFSAENVAKWRSLSSEQGQKFVYEGELFLVHSSNVAAFQYYIEDEKMMVEYLDGSAYLYSNVPENVAIAAFQAQSKGGFIWSFFRVRGSKTGHRVPYTKLRTGTRKGRKLKKLTP